MSKDFAGYIATINKMTDIRNDLTDHVRRFIAELASCNKEDVETPYRNTKPNSRMRNRNAISGSECVKANDNKEHNVDSLLKVA